MNIKAECLSMRLGRRERVELIDGVGTVITCRAGCLWVTQHRDSRDMVIGPGESVVLDRPGLAVVQALAASSVAFKEPVPACGRLAAWVDKRWHGPRDGFGVAAALTPAPHL